MAHDSNGRIYRDSTYGVNIYDDINYVLGKGTGDLMTLCRADNIAKFAKWHPVPSSELDLPSVEARRTAGRSSFADQTVQYGVRCKGIGTTVTLNDIHQASFEYVGIGNGRARVLDFVHPTLYGYGYRHNAYLDFSAEVRSWGGGADGSVRRISRSVIINITYNPHSEELRKEMLSIRDFMQNNTSPLGYYPCVLFTNANKHYIHCLYKEEGGETASAPETLTQGTSVWILDASGLPSDMHDGEYSMSVFLASQRRLDGTVQTDIASWLSINNSGDMQAWSAWFLPVPDVCGFTATVGGVAATKAHVVGIGPLSVQTNGFSVSYQFDKNYQGTVVVDIDADLAINTQRKGSSRKSETYSSVETQLLRLQTFNYTSDYSIIGVQSGDAVTVKAKITTTADGVSSTSELYTKTFTIQ